MEEVQHKTGGEQEMSGYNASGKENGAARNTQSWCKHEHEYGTGQEGGRNDEQPLEEWDLDDP